MCRASKPGIWIIAAIAAIMLFSDSFLVARAEPSPRLELADSPSPTTDTFIPPSPTTETNILPTLTEVPPPEVPSTAVLPTLAPPTEAPPTEEPEPRRTRLRAEQPTITLTPTSTPTGLTPTVTPTPSVAPEGPITGGTGGLELLLWGFLLAGIVGAGLALGLGWESRAK
jgi:hypothetical protein